MQNSPTPAAASGEATVSHAGITAMRNRAAQLVLTMAWLGKGHDMRYAQGMLAALDDLLDGLAATEFAARRDASAGSYQPLGGFEAAWTALPPRLKDLTMSKVQEFLQAHGVEFPLDNIAHSQLNAGLQLKYGEVPAIDRNDEHAAARADLNDVTGHVAPLVVLGVDIQRAGIACGARMSATVFKPSM